MTIKVGDKIPDMKFKVRQGGDPKDMTTDELFKGKKVVLFAVPGAFTPTCSMKHLPGFIGKYDELTKKGVDTVACLSVNDHFVMGAWAKDQGAGDKIAMIADGKLKLHIAKTYPLAEAPQAHRDMESRKVAGKLLLVP